MKFDNASSCEEVIWQMRLSEQVRAEDRTIILGAANGNPPFDEATAEENDIQVNVSDLSLVNLLSGARRQWNNNYLKPKHFFTLTPDVGPSHKIAEWSSKVTKNANRVLKRNRRMVGQIRATGGNAVLSGIGPVNWRDRQTVIPTPIPVGSLMIPSETEVDEFDNLSYFAIFREYTAAQLWDMTHGPKTDPGWNMKLVQAQWEYIKDELRKSPNSLAYQYMPERIEELMKQDKGYMGTDAIPTVDVWDFYFREEEEGKGWYRRIILDWNVGQDVSGYKDHMPPSRNQVDGASSFLYTSRNRKFANSVSEIIHCNIADCSAYFPQKYHSIRSLGWMLWGVCDLQNRLHCKFNEAVFEQCMWFFQTASNNDLIRLKKANFAHMGVIPQGIKFLTAAERFTPNMQLLNMAFARNRQLMADSSTSYTQQYDEGEGGRGRTATETMAIVNATQSLASGIAELSSTYEAFKYQEMFRRLCLKYSRDPMAREFRKRCLQDGIPEKMLEADLWNIEPEQPIGGGNKTLQMAQVQFLNNIRKNLPPDGQRLVDYLSVEAATDQPDLAERMAPIGKDKPISNSTHDAQLATDRLLRGLPFNAPKEAVFEDYVIVWLHDMGSVIQRIMQRGGLATVDELAGLYNLAQGQKDANGDPTACIAQFLAIMENQIGQGAGDQDDSAKLKQYQDAFGQLMNHLKGLTQRYQEAARKQAGGNGQPAGGVDPKEAAKVQAMMIQAQAKAQNLRESHAIKTQQRQTQFQLEQQRKDAETQAQIEREGVVTRHELMRERLKSLAE